MKTKTILFFVAILILIIAIFNSSGAVSETTNDIVVQDAVQTMQ